MAVAGSMSIGGTMTMARGITMDVIIGIISSDLCTDWV